MGYKTCTQLSKEFLEEESQGWEEELPSSGLWCAALTWRCWERVKEQEKDWDIASLLMNKEVGFSRASHTLQGAQAAEAEAVLDGIL